jgi:hypothetical protein
MKPPFKDSVTEGKSAVNKRLHFSTKILTMKKKNERGDDGVG